MKKIKVFCPACEEGFRDHIEVDKVVECPLCGNSLYISEIKQNQANALKFNMDIDCKGQIRLGCDCGLEENFEDDDEEEE